ncbi:hypothetical protein B0J12DRAFT_151585 [Macrophomina phaseolina]|uniref:Secreted protein n=1 Tax=Macrophomina phaseolina TaxID=35725 RepID=A0ABQ8G510_9PEZI|nr:hypothetical protein B0J12DRAFT_151585 [Macrophomina phaseolina]
MMMMMLRATPLTIKCVLRVARTGLALAGGWAAGLASRRPARGACFIRLETLISQSCARCSTVAQSSGASAKEVFFFLFCEQQGAAACGRARQRSNRCRLARLRAVMDRGVPRGQPTGQAGWWANARRQWFGCLVIIDDFHAVGETEAGFGAALISHGAPVSSR